MWVDWALPSRGFVPSGSDTVSPKVGASTPTPLNTAIPHPIPHRKPHSLPGQLLQQLLELGPWS